KNPKYFTEPEQAVAPEPTGELLLALDRDEGTKQVRFYRDTFNGHAFISARVWRFDQASGWWPTRAGFSIRLREIGAVVEALQGPAGQGNKGADVPDAPLDDRPQYVERRRRVEPRDPGKPLPRSVPSDEKFDEF